MGTVLLSYFHLEALHLVKNIQVIHHLCLSTTEQQGLHVLPYRLCAHASAVHMRLKARSSTDQTEISKGLYGELRSVQ